MRNKNISEDRKKYLRKIYIQKASILITQISLVIFFIVMWEVLADKQIIDSFIMSQPSRMVESFINLSHNGLLKHVIVTCSETLAGFLLGTFLGSFIAILLWWSNFLSKVSEPFLVILNSLPKVALRTSNNNMGRFRNASNNCNGTCNIVSSYNTRNFKRIYRNRQRKN